VFLSIFRRIFISFVYEPSNSATADSKYTCDH